jgi:hypothetical protein
LINKIPFYLIKIRVHYKDPYTFSKVINIDGKASHRSKYDQYTSEQDIESTQFPSSPRRFWLIERAGGEDGFVGSLEVTVQLPVDKEGLNGESIP